MLPQCQKQTDKQNRGAVRGLSWSGAVESQLSAFTATCIRKTVALLSWHCVEKKKTEHRTHIFRQGAWKLCFAQTSSRGAGLKELKVDVSGSQWHASAGTILTPLNLSDPSVPALSLPRCGSSKISLLQGASNYEGVNEAQRKVFCFSFSCRVKKKQKKIYILLHLTFKSQHSAGKKQQHWNLIRWTLLTYLLFNEPEKFKYNACMVLLQKWD